LIRQARKVGLRLCLTSTPGWAMAKRSQPSSVPAPLSVIQTPLGTAVDHTEARNGTRIVFRSRRLVSGLSAEESRM
jgi:hypothetical protein